MFALIHSPLVGPSTWKPVAEQLERKSYQAIVPVLVDDETTDRPFWEQEAESAAESINGINSPDAFILVGHSGAGPILPAIGARLDRAPAGYIFVDAGLPQNQARRLDLMQAESPQWADDFEKYLRIGRRFPAWTDADLDTIIPDGQLRQQLLAGLRPRGLSFFTEPISIIEGWERTPCGYILFSETYEFHAEQARELGWPLIQLEGGHFHMLVDPNEVAGALIRLAEQFIS